MNVKDVKRCLNPFKEIVVSIVRMVRSNVLQFRRESDAAEIWYHSYDEKDRVLIHTVFPRKTILERAAVGSLGKNKSLPQILTIKLVYFMTNSQ